MGMDGLSMANTGALKESTSADYANRTEQSVQANPSNNSKQVQTLETNRAVREKEEEEENNGKNSNKNDNQDNEEEVFEDGLVEETETEESEPLSKDFDIDELDNPNREFYVKLNAKDDIIELYDSSTERLIETISGNELQELVRKLNMASGIFVNKKV